jgi:myo-inositol-1(or 4)-monophosphatase
MIRTPLMNVMTAAVQKAAKGLKRDFGEVGSLQVTRKGPADFVSKADKASEAVLHAELAKARPGYCFRMEETGSVEGADKTHVWHIDPLDGTTNFLHGLPLFAISVGLEREGVPVAGVIYNPITEEMFMAERGQGAFVNNQRLRVAGRTDTREAVVSLGIPNIGRGDHPRFLREVAQIMAQSAGLRRLGSAALDLAYVAAGRFDLFYERGLNTWDICAGVALVREAGGYAADISGQDNPLPTGDIIAGNETMVNAYRKLILQAG